MLDIEKKFGTQNWDMRVNLSILSNIIVDTWCVVKGILGEGYNNIEGTFFTKLAEEMIVNTLNTAHRTRGQASTIKGVTSPSSLDTFDGQISSGVGIHLTPTK